MVTAADVKSFLGLDPTDTIDDKWIQWALDAAVDYLALELPHRDWRNPTDRERLGMVMLAGRFFERRGADGNDVNAGYDFSGPIPLVGRQIEQLLGLGRYFGPVVA